MNEWPRFHPERHDAGRPGEFWCTSHLGGCDMMCKENQPCYCCLDSTVDAVQEVVERLDHILDLRARERDIADYPWAQGIQDARNMLWRALDGTL